MSATFYEQRMMAGEFLSIMAFLFGVYLCLRWAYGLHEPFPWSQSRPVDFDRKGFDAAEISGRIRHMQENLADVKSPPSTTRFKQEAMVKIKREEISNLAFFQKASKGDEAAALEHRQNSLLV